MDTKNWFGEHAHTVRMFALIGGVVLAAIILFDILAGKRAASAAATGMGTDTAANGATSSLNPGETNISVFEDYSNHTDTVTSNQYEPPRPHVAPGSIYTIPPLPSVQGTGLPAPRYEGGPVPIPTPHSADMYTVHSGDSLWSIAAAKLGSGFDWRELYNWNRGAVGSNPNLIYPGEVLQLGA